MRYSLTPQIEVKIGIDQKKLYFGEKLLDLKAWTQLYETIIEIDEKVVTLFSQQPQVYKKESIESNNIVFMNASDHCGCDNINLWGEHIWIINHNNLDPVIDKVKSYVKGKLGF